MSDIVTVVDLQKINNITGKNTKFFLEKNERKAIEAIEAIETLKPDVLQLHIGLFR